MRVRVRESESERERESESECVRGRVRGRVRVREDQERSRDTKTQTQRYKNTHTRVRVSIILLCFGFAFIITSNRIKCLLGGGKSKRVAFERFWCAHDKWNPGNVLLLSQVAARMVWLRWNVRDKVCVGACVGA